MANKKAKKRPMNPEECAMAVRAFMDDRSDNEFENKRMDKCAERAMSEISEFVNSSFPRPRK